MSEAQSASIVWMQGGDRRTTRSNASGEFQLREASAGPVRVRVSHPGFATRAFPILAPVALIVYYLAWKYLVGFFNRVLGLA